MSVVPLAAILDSFKDPVLFADTDHVIRYMNRAAIAHYDEGAALLGRSLLDCHNHESQRQMKEILEAMHRGEEERLITENDTQRIYMRSVRSRGGVLLGYYERYERRVEADRSEPAASCEIRSETKTEADG